MVEHALLQEVPVKPEAAEGGGRLGQALLALPEARTID
jgi:hypothetical protein